MDNFIQEILLLSKTKLNLIHRHSQTLTWLMHFHNYASAIIIQSVIQNADLFRSENPVAGIAETGNDIAVIVEVAVNRSGVDDNIGVQLM